MKEVLSKKQEDFCRLYVSLGSASDAARLAGYRFPASRLAAARLLEMPEIKKRVKKLNDALSLSALRKEALKGLCRIALCDPADALRLLSLEDGSVQEAVERSDLLCVAEIKRQKGEKGVTEIKFIDRVKALDALCRLCESDAESRADAGDLINAVKASVGGGGFEA